MSQYEELFGEGYVGRPRSDEESVGVPSGDKKVTEAARRRATRVLRVKHSTEFSKIMAEEIDFLLQKGA